MKSIYPSVYYIPNWLQIFINKYCVVAWFRFIWLYNCSQLINIKLNIPFCYISSTINKSNFVWARRFFKQQINLQHESAEYFFFFKQHFNNKNIKCLLGRYNFNKKKICRFLLSDDNYHHHVTIRLTKGIE